MQAAAASMHLAGYDSVGALSNPTYTQTFRLLTPHCHQRELHHKERPSDGNLSSWFTAAGGSRRSLQAVAEPAAAVRAEAVWLNTELPPRTFAQHAPDRAAAAAAEVVAAAPAIAAAPSPAAATVPA